ncbi:hypothetical protein KY290_028846 [Solanum tuberosum]|uniref:Uncharacterized protein n=1 Tax=Solanum tuberosum TaxID=4113 RepID=A0ABQ7UJE3_SOLTU|nr:hypothetical protein KY289_028033 [Solanum tuberosum]KAH0749614.1 hypothetical protein KY290_028846 [Solanum tuberosum]
MTNFSGAFSITEASSPTEAGPARTGTAGRDDFIFRLSISATACHGFWHDAALVLPSVLFVLYLGFHARSNIKKLSHRRSFVMIGYYGLLWFAVLLNLGWRADGEESSLSWGSLALVIGWQRVLGMTGYFKIRKKEGWGVAVDEFGMKTMVYQASNLSQCIKVPLGWEEFLEGKGACIRVWNASYLLYQCCYDLRIPNTIEVVNHYLYVLLFLEVLLHHPSKFAKQVWQCTPGKQVAWNLLSLFATSAMLFLEISIVAFLLKENYASCLETLARKKHPVFST